MPLVKEEGPDQFHWPGPEKDLGLGQQPIWDLALTNQGYMLGDVIERDLRQRRTARALNLRQEVCACLTARSSKRRAVHPPTSPTAARAPLSATSGGMAPLEPTHPSTERAAPPLALIALPRPRNAVPRHPCRHQSRRRYCLARQSGRAGGKFLDCTICATDPSNARRTRECWNC
jgi:hypothetical protein